MVEPAPASWRAGAIRDRAPAAAAFDRHRRSFAVARLARRRACSPIWSASGSAATSIWSTPSRAEISGRPCVNSTVGFAGRRGLRGARHSARRRSRCRRRLRRARRRRRHHLRARDLPRPVPTAGRCRRSWRALRAITAWRSRGRTASGIINYVDGVPLTFSACAPVPANGRRSIGIVSQSGAMATVLRAALHARDIAISFSISTGNEALNGVEDFLEPSDRRRIHPCARAGGRAVPASATLPRAGAPRAWRRQADRSAASRPQRRGARSRPRPIPAPSAATTRSCARWWRTRASRWSSRWRS